VEAGAEPVSGDLKDPQSLQAACEGVTTVITTANSAQRGGDDNPQTVDLEGNRALIDAASDNGVEHFIFVSALGASTDSPSDFIRAKARTEQRLQQSGMDYTILQPNYFKDVWIPMIVGLPLQQGEPVRLIGEGKRRHSIVAANDVAAFAVAAVDHPEARNQVLLVGGPEPLSWQDIVERTGHALNREIPIEHLPIGAELPGLPPVVTDLMTATEMYDSPLEMDSLATTYGVSLTPFDEWLRQSPLAPPV
jgi:NADH dehydrogenase